MIQSPELQAKLAAWRSRVNDGTITQPELIEALRALRAERSAAQAASAASKSRGGGGGKRSSKAPVDTNALKASLLDKLKKS